MKIYDYKEYEQKQKELGLSLFDDDKILKQLKPIAIIDKDIEDNFKIGKKYYTIHICRPSEWAIVEEFEIQNGKELYGEEFVTCPYCGAIEQDCFEFRDEEKNYKCSVCGSIYAYQRIVNVAYDMQPIKKAKIKRIL